MNNININLTLSISDEDRARIDALLSKLAPVEMKTETFHEIDPEKPQNTPQEAPKAEPQEKSQPEPETATEAAEPESYDITTPQYTVADVQQKVVALCANGKKTEVKAIVSAYAERVSLIPAEKADEVMERLNALEG